MESPISLGSFPRVLRQDARGRMLAGRFLSHLRGLPTSDRRRSKDDSPDSTPAKRHAKREK